MSEPTPGPWGWHNRDGMDEDKALILSSIDNINVLMPMYHHASGTPYLQFANADDMPVIAFAPETAAERDRLKAVNAQLAASLQEHVRWHDDHNIDEGWPGSNLRSRALDALTAAKESP